MNNSGIGAPNKALCIEVGNYLLKETQSAETNYQYVKTVQKLCQMYDEYLLSIDKGERYDVVLSQRNYLLSKLNEFSPDEEFFNTLEFILRSNERQPLSYSFVTSKCSDGHADKSVDKRLPVEEIYFEVATYVKKRYKHESVEDAMIRFCNKKGKNFADVYNSVNIDRRHFAMIMNRNGRMKKLTMLRFAIGLNLDIDETVYFLGLADYGLNREKVDLVFRYFIEHKNYNYFELRNTVYDVCNMDIENPNASIE